MTMRTTVKGDRRPKPQRAGEMKDNAARATRSPRALGDTTENGGNLSPCGRPCASSED